MSAEPIWYGEVSPSGLTNMSRGCLIETLGIEPTEIMPDSLYGRMPVEDRDRFHRVGMEINANRRQRQGPRMGQYARPVI